MGDWNFCMSCMFCPHEHECDGNECMYGGGPDLEPDPETQDETKDDNTEI